MAASPYCADPAIGAIGCPAEGRWRLGFTIVAGENLLDKVLDMIAGGLAGYGILGIWALYLIWQNWQKDQIIAKLNDRNDTLIDRSVDRETETVKVLTELTILVRAFGGKL